MESVLFLELSSLAENIHVKNQKASKEKSKMIFLFLKKGSYKEVEN